MKISFKAYFSFRSVIFHDSPFLFLLIDVTVSIRRMEVI